jgi:hypothetical protein
MEGMLVAKRIAQHDVESLSIDLLREVLYVCGIQNYDES